MEDAEVSVENEARMHQQAILDLSNYLNVPMNQVSMAYAQELALLGKTANVRSYLPILVRRRVKSLLSKKSEEGTLFK